VCAFTSTDNPAPRTAMAPLTDNDAELVLLLGEVRGELASTTESVVSLRGHVDAVGRDIAERLHDMDMRVRAVERDVHLIMRAGAFAAACVVTALAWVLTQLA